MKHFIKYSEIPDNIIKIANNIEEKEKFLYEIINDDILNEVLQSAIINSIIASYQIENEYLNKEFLEYYVADCLKNSVENWFKPDNSIESNYIDERERKAAQSVLSCLNCDNLNHGAIFQIMSLAFDKRIDNYRKHPEVVKSGSRIIYQAPDAEFVPELMDNFIEWWNNDRLKMPYCAGSAIAHYIFVKIHPFIDGNGRCARALAEKALINNGNILKPYSVSAQILKNRLDYYGALRTDNPVKFIEYILNMQDKAIDCGIKEAQRFDFLRLFFKRDDFSDSEKEIIKKMSLFPDSKWKADDFYLIDDYENIFNELKRKDVINSENKFNLNYRPCDMLSPR